MLCVQSGFPFLNFLIEPADSLSVNVDSDLTAAICSIIVP